MITSTRTSVSSLMVITSYHDSCSMAVLASPLFLLEPRGCESLLCCEAGRFFLPFPAQVSAEVVIYTPYSPPAVISIPGTLVPTNIGHLDASILSPNLFFSQAKPMPLRCQAEHTFQPKEMDLPSVTAATCTAWIQALLRFFDLSFLFFTALLVSSAAPLLMCEVVSDSNCWDFLSQQSDAFGVVLAVGFGSKSVKDMKSANSSPC